MLVAQPEPTDKPPENAAKAGEPVIPSFPVGGQACFLAVRGGISYRARVQDLPDDPNELLRLLVKGYPGLPERYLSDILTDTLVAAGRVPADHTYRILVTETDAILQDVDDGVNLYPIWKDRKTETYL